MNNSIFYGVKTFRQIMAYTRDTSSPKGNDAHLRAIIQSEKKWKHQFFRCLRQLTLWSVVGSGRISTPSKLLCMSSLHVSMKRIPSRTTKKKWQYRFSNYNTICCHGNQRSDLAKFRTHPSFYACPHCLENDYMEGSGSATIK